MSVVSFPGGKKDAIPASQALREFADLLEQMEEAYGTVEVAGVALIPELGTALCGNSETGNDGMMTMFEIGKTAIVMQYLNGDYEDEPDTIH